MFFYLVLNLNSFTALMSLVSVPSFYIVSGVIELIYQLLDFIIAILVLMGKAKRKSASIQSAYRLTLASVVISIINNVYYQVSLWSFIEDMYEGSWKYMSSQLTSTMIQVSIYKLLQLYYLMLLSSFYYEIVETGDGPISNKVAAEPPLVGVGVAVVGQPIPMSIPMGAVAVPVTETQPLTDSSVGAVPQMVPLQQQQPLLPSKSSPLPSQHV